MKRLSKFSRSIKGKIVLVTGAASGMGMATAELFSDEALFLSQILCFHACRPLRAHTHTYKNTHTHTLAYEVALYLRV